MLCMTVFQSSTDICRRYIHYTELGRSDSVVFKCINISDVNIENFFEILGMVGDLFQNSTENICSTSRVCIHIQEKYSFNFNKFIHIQEKYSYAT